jgi:hypothetical protein
LADQGSLHHGVGWQRQRGSEDGANFVVCKTSFLGGVKVIERYPFTEQGWAAAWSSLVQRDADAARAILARLAARRAAVSGPDAIFPALGVQVAGEAVEAYAAPPGVGSLGPLAGAEARLTDGSQAWSPGRAMFLAAQPRGIGHKDQGDGVRDLCDGSCTTRPRLTAMPLCAPARPRPSSSI